MFLPEPKRASGHGFTLIELLTVITIIAVLIGLLFPVIGSVMTKARRTQASAEEVRIINAVSAYQTEYGRLPLNSRNTGYVTCYGDPGDNSLYPGYELFDILRAIPETATNDPSGNMYNANNQLNPKQVVYFQGNDAKNPADPRGGFLLVNHNDGNYTMKARSLVDPWGNEYIVWLDGNGSGTLNPVINPYFYTIPIAQGPPGPVQVSSLGPDNEFGTAGNKMVSGSDDVVTW